MILLTCTGSPEPRCIWIRGPIHRFTCEAEMGLTEVKCQVTRATTLMRGGPDIVWSREGLPGSCVAISGRHGKHCVNPDCDRLSLSMSSRAGGLAMRWGALWSPAASRDAHSAGHPLGPGSQTRLHSLSITSTLFNVALCAPATNNLLPLLGSKDPIHNPVDQPSMLRCPLFLFHPRHCIELLKVACKVHGFVGNAKRLVRMPRSLALPQNE